MIKKELYENYRKQPREYQIRLLAESKCDSNFKRTVGESIFELYECIYFKHIAEDSEEDFLDKDSNFLFFLDLVSVYVLDVPVMEAESDPETHINMLADENLRAVLKHFISLKSNL